MGGERVRALRLRPGGAAGGAAGDGLVRDALGAIELQAAIVGAAQSSCMLTVAETVEGDDGDNAAGGAAGDPAGEADGSVGGGGEGGGGAGGGGVGWLVLYSLAAVFRPAVLVKKLSIRRRRRVGGAGWWEASNTGSHCGGQVTPFSWRITLNRSVRTQRSEEAS